MVQEPEHEVPEINIAYLHDRICLNERRPQFFGTQFTTNRYGAYGPQPIEDIDHVDERRGLIGVNIGSEQHSQSKDFSRPVLVVKKFTEKMYLGIPLTTKIRVGGFRFCFTLNGVQNDALLHQMRSFDAKRFISKIGVLSKFEFDLLNKQIANLFIENMKTPIKGVSEAEARVCTDVSTKYPYTRSIEEQRLLSRFYGVETYDNILLDRLSWNTDLRR